jgi:Zn-dependent protease with chaperone function
MSRFIRVGFACGLVAVLASCTALRAGLSRATGGAIPPPAASVSAQAAASSDGTSAPEAQAAEKRCEEMLKLEVALKEERAFGGAMALGLAMRGNGIGLDVSDKLKVEDLRGMKALELPSSPMNDVTRYVELVGKNLAQQSSRPMLVWTFGVIDSDEVNAFAAPGGYVMVTRGLLRKVENEAQLAGVLAHEIAHVTEKHALETYRQSKFHACQTAYGIKSTARDVVSTIAGDAADELKREVEWQLGFSLPLDVARSVRGAVAKSIRGFIDLDSEENLPVLKELTDKVIDEVLARGVGPTQEFDADRVAFELLVNAGYNPNEFTRFLDKIQDSGGAFPTHPKKEERQAKLNAFRDTALKGNPFFGADHPFEKYVVPPIKDELGWAKK